MPAERESAILLEEYRSLRDEILQIAQRQFLTVTLVTGALGTLVGIIAPNAGIADHPKPSAVALLYLAFLLLFAGVVMMIHLSRQTQVIASYIREFIETEIPDLNWETRWQALRESTPTRLLKSKLPRGTSKVFALYFAILTVGLVALAVAVKVYRIPWSLPGLVMLAVGTSLAISDLYGRWISGRTPDWSTIRVPANEVANLLRHFPSSGPHHPRPVDQILLWA